MKLFVVGSGKLANAIINSQISVQSSEIVHWETHYQTFAERAIIVHAGSGRQLHECVEFCKRTKSVFIELSTGLETETMESDFPLILCPNTSILVLKTLNMIKAQGLSFEKYTISITESHQSTKKTEPGTAYTFAKAVQFPLEKIVSIRDPEIQHCKIGIPPEYLDKHAYHKLVISDGNDQVTIETKVLGHDSYARGVKAVIEAVVNLQLENKKYTVLDLIDKNLL